MAQQILSTNTFTSSTWIVNSDATKGTHTTLAGALTTSASGDTILLQTSVTENVTLKAGVNIVGYSGADLKPNVSITGKCSFSSAGTVTLENVQLITNSDNFLAVTGSAASIVYLRNCFLNASNNTGISFTTANTGALVQCAYCQGNIGTTGIGMHSMSSTGNLEYFWCSFTNNGGSSTASSSSAGAVSIWYSNFPYVLTASGGTLGLLYSIINTATQNATTITTSTGGGHTIQFCSLASGTASCISVGASTQVTIENSIIDSTNTNAITGAGTISYQCLSFPNSSKTINTTTQNVSGTLPGSTTTAPTAGFLGEEIRSVASAASVSMSSNTPKNITSISLTAGVWNVTGAIQYAGSGTSTYCWCSVNTTSATLGTTCDNSFQGSPAALGSRDGVAECPNFRLTLTSTTTVYLVGQCDITAGSINSGGRISAVRVG